MRRYALLLLSVILGARGDLARYELRGRLVPGTRASVWLDGATAPFEASTLAGDDGHFRFRDVQTGAYILGAFVPGRGELRRTIEVGPSQAVAGHRIDLVVELRDSEFESNDSLRRSALVSAKELAIPDGARHEYEEAGRKLARREVDAAVAHLRRAVEIAPQFAEAWNHLGTIAYQTQDYARAESCFRNALSADANLFEPLVNLGGVLINLSKFREALQYNLYAELSRPGDALANSQLGMTYFYLDKLDLAKKYLTAAKRLDPAHFSHPQLILAQIDLRLQDRAAAAGELREFLQYHPDSPDAAKIKDDIARLTAPANPAREFATTGMARSFVQAPDLPSVDAATFRIRRHDGRAYLETRDPEGHVQEARIDATIGSGRHVRILLSRGPDGAWTELPLAWYPQEGGRYAVGPGFAFSDTCLTCHAQGSGDQSASMGCAACHGTAEAAKPSQAACLKCHVEAVGPGSSHRPGVPGDEKVEINSAGYRLLESHCYRASAGKLTCTTCHPPHAFAKTTAEYRMVCRGCHPTQHNSAALDCTRCHMPKRAAQDAPQIMVTDHRIQRPL